MEKKKKRPEGRREKINTQGAALVIERLARREGTTPEMVRKHIQAAMLDGLVSDDPKMKAQWERIPKAGEVPTPEELIVFLTQEAMER